MAEITLGMLQNIVQLNDESTSFIANRTGQYRISRLIFKINENESEIEGVTTSAVHNVINLQ